MNTRLFELSVGNVIHWQDHPQRGCARWAQDPYIALELAPQIIIEGTEKKVFHENSRFLTRPIGAALEVPVLTRNSKIERDRT